MKEYRIAPRINHNTKVMFVKAGSADDARAIAKDHIERRFGCDWFGIDDVQEVAPLPAGEVVAR